MYGIRRLAAVLVAIAGLMTFPARGAEGFTAGTGQVTVTVNLVTSSLSITATFANASYPPFGVNLGPVGTVSATSVALTNTNLSTGASFVVPFANLSNSFDAAGEIACPAGGCLATASGPYAFVGVLKNVNVSLLPANFVYTFDGSATCTGSLVLTCSGPFVLNAFALDPIAPATAVVIDRAVTFLDPALGMSRSFDARIVLTNVTVGGMLSVVGVSRFRGIIPAGYATTSGSNHALFFDVATNATFTGGRVCVEVDANPQDGIVDGTTLTLNQLAILHGVSGSFVPVPLVFPPTFVCADALTSLSPFVLLFDTTPPTTTTTSSSTSTSTSTTSTSSTSISTTTTTSHSSTLISTTTTTSTSSTSISVTTTTSTSSTSITMTTTTSTSSTSIPMTSTSSSSTSTSTSSTTTTSTLQTTTTTEPPASTTTTTLPPACATARQCLEQVRAQPLCAETINPKLQGTITRKTAAALTKLGKAAGTTTPAKIARFVRQARASLKAIQTKADKFVNRKNAPISTECRDSIRRALEPVLGAIDASHF